jgi:hypothetical protein
MLRDAVGWAKLPEDIQSLLRGALKHAFPWVSAAVIALQGWWAEASFEQTATFSIVALVILYIVVFGLSVLRDRGVFDRLAERRESGGEREQLREDKREAEQQHDMLLERVKTLESQATRPRTEAEELKHSCCQLAAELYQFAEECFQEKLELLHKRQNAETEEERQDAAKELRPGPSSRFRGSIRFKYKTSFRDRATILLGKAAERGWTEPSDKDLAQHVEDNLAAIEGIASILSDICNRD